MDFEEWQQHNFFAHFLLISRTGEFKAFLSSLVPFFQPDHAQKMHSSTTLHCHQHPTKQICLASHGHLWNLCWHVDLLSLSGNFLKPPLTQWLQQGLQRQQGCPYEPAFSASQLHLGSCITGSQDLSQGSPALNDIPLASQTCRNERITKSGFRSLPCPKITSLTAATPLVHKGNVPLPQVRFAPFSSSCRGRTMVIPSSMMLSWVSQPEERPQQVLSCTSSVWDGGPRKRNGNKRCRFSQETQATAFDQSLPWDVTVPPWDN